MCWAGMNIFSYIKARVMILDVVREYATLKKAGGYWKGSCPFHHERTGSFTVSPSKEIFYCFGCHIGGDVISFVQKAENCSPFEAANHLIERYSISLEGVDFDSAPYKKEEKEKYFQLSSFFAQWAYEQAFMQREVTDYLKKRGVTDRSRSDFLIGYVPAGQAAVKMLLTQGQKHSFLAQDFLEAKLLLEGKQGLYCPFEDRLLFLINDHLGRVVGYGGRILKEGDTRPKYYNSHDHQFFNKGTILYGLDRAKKAIQERGQVVLVEGYMDALMMSQYGYTNTVATLGTACTLEHLIQLGRYAPQIHVIYDGDRAGQKAMVRLAQLCWQAEVDLSVISLPAQDDPASFLYKGGDLSKPIAQAQDIFLFFVQSLAGDFQAKGLQERVEIVKKILATIGAVNDGLKQELLLHKMAAACQIPVHILQRELNSQHNEQQRIMVKRAHEQRTIEQGAEQLDQSIENKISQLEKKIFSAILTHQELVEGEDRELLNEHISLALQPLYNKIMTMRQQEPAQDVVQVMAGLTDKEKAFLSCCLIEVEEEKLAHLLDQLYKKKWKMIVHESKIKIEQAQKSGDGVCVRELLSDVERWRKKIMSRGTL
jgi:DNA primase